MLKERRKSDSECFAYYEGMMDILFANPEIIEIIDKEGIESPNNEAAFDEDAIKRVLAIMELED